MTLPPQTVLDRRWMRSIELQPGERLLNESGSAHDHQWHRSIGKAFLTNERFLFQGYFFPFSLNPSGHEHRWRLDEISQAGQSRHAKTFFLRRVLFLDVADRTHWFMVRQPELWLAQLAELGIARG